MCEWGRLVTSLLHVLRVNLFSNCGDRNDYCCMKPIVLEAVLPVTVRTCSIVWLDYFILQLLSLFLQCYPIFKFVVNPSAQVVIANTERTQI